MEEKKKNRESKLERVWRKGKRRGRDRDNNVCEGDSKKKKQKRMDEMKETKEI